MVSTIGHVHDELQRQATYKWNTISQPSLGGSHSDTIITLSQPQITLLLLLELKLLNGINVIAKYEINTVDNL